MQIPQSIFKDYFTISISKGVFIKDYLKNYFMTIF